MKKLTLLSLICLSTIAMASDVYVCATKTKYGNLKEKYQTKTLNKEVSFGSLKVRTTEKNGKVIFTKKLSSSFSYIPSILDAPMIAGTVNYTIRYNDKKKAFSVQITNVKGSEANLGILNSVIAPLDPTLKVIGLMNKKQSKPVIFKLNQTATLKFGKVNMAVICRDEAKTKGIAKKAIKITKTAHKKINQIRKKADFPYNPRTGRIGIGPKAVTK